MLLVLLNPPVIAEPLSSDPPSPAYLTLVNNSDYSMMYAVWEDGSECTGRLQLPDEVDLNLKSPGKIVIPAAREIAVGVGITEMRGNTPVFCEHIISFTPKVFETYLLEYYVRDRRCFSLLHRQENGKFVPVLEDSAEELKEKIAEFGWDQFEPACTE